MDQKEYLGQILSEALERYIEDDKQFTTYFLEYLNVSDDDVISNEIVNIVLMNQEIYEYLSPLLSMVSSEHSKQVLEAVIKETVRRLNDEQDLCSE